MRPLATSPAKYEVTTSGFKVAATLNPEVVTSYLAEEVAKGRTPAVGKFFENPKCRGPEEPICCKFDVLSVR